MMIEAEDVVVTDYAKRLWRRVLPKCIDIRQPPDGVTRADYAPCLARPL
jgi:hypothetical protein